MMRKRFIGIALVLTLASLAPLAAQDRYALVIGNNAYRGNGLPALANPVNDASDIAAALRDLGYTVELKTNLAVSAMDDALDRFFSQLRAGENTEGFFWFAGHGLSLEGKQRLLAVDADISSDSRIERGSCEVDSLVERFRNTRNRGNLIVIDACRNVVVPGARAAVSRGLSVVSAGEIGVRGNKLIYSTMQGKTAADGQAGKRNSPFAEAFLAGMKKADTFENVFITIASDTLRLTGGEQEPYALGYFSVPNYALNTAAVAAIAPATAPGISGQAGSGSVQVTSATTGDLWIDGRDTGMYVKPGGGATVQNVTAGETKVSIKTADGWVFSIVTRVDSGKTATVAFQDRPQDFETASSGNGITIAKYTGQGGSVVIPESAGGKRVTTIGGNAFSFSSLASVTIPDSVITIGASAFSWCFGLSSVTIPDSVTSIGEAAFGRSGLTSVTIPDSVTSIGESAFALCYSLTTISVPSANRYYKDIDGVLFTKDGRTLHTYPQGREKTAYAIPDGVTSIGASAFYSCTLASITIPDGVTTIDDYAFAHCSLSSVTIPDGVTSIGASAFNFCYLTSVTIPKSVKKVGRAAFGNNRNLDSTVYKTIRKRFGKKVFERY